MCPLGDYAAKSLGYKKVAIIAEDFTYGHEGAGGFHLAFEAAGGKIVQKLWPPLNTPEYAPYLAQIKPDVDAIYMGFAGSNPVRFLKQFTDFGLKGKVAVLGNTTSTDEGSSRRPPCGHFTRLITKPLWPRSEDPGNGDGQRRGSPCEDHPSACSAATHRC